MKYIYYSIVWFFINKKHKPIIDKSLICLKILILLFILGMIYDYAEYSIFTGPYKHNTIIHHILNPSSITNNPYLFIILIFNRIIIGFIFSSLFYITLVFLQIPITYLIRSIDDALNLMYDKGVEVEDEIAPIVTKSTLEFKLKHVNTTSKIPKI